MSMTLSIDQETLAARRAIESLRSGVPNREAVAQLGTTQDAVERRFQKALASVAAGEGTEPLVIAANFGSGKSHLLNYLQVLAEREQFVSSFVVISPETPLGNAHVVLKAVGEAAHAPGRLGKALRALMFDFRISSPAWEQLNVWAGVSGIDDRFSALLLLYERFRADEEFRLEILGDFEGKPIPGNIVRRRLREIGDAPPYRLAAVRNPSLAHDRLRLMAQIFRTAGCKGIVVLFDELERTAKFSTKQRIAVYEQLGWWRAMAREPGSGILPVFAMTDAFVGGSVTGGTADERRFVTQSGGAEDARDRRALEGIEILKPPHTMFLDSPRAGEEDEIRARLHKIYVKAYGAPINPPPMPRASVRVSIRSEIRRWITQWDLLRYYPDYGSRLVVEDINFDASEIPDEQLQTGEDEDDNPFSEN